MMLLKLELATELLIGLNTNRYEALAKVTARALLGDVVVQVRVFHYNCCCYSVTRFYLSTPRGEEHSEKTSKHDICPCPDGIDELCAIQRRKRIDESEHRKRDSRFRTSQHRSKHHNHNHKDKEAQKASQEEHIRRHRHHQSEWRHQHHARDSEIASAFNETIAS